MCFRQKATLRVSFWQDSQDIVSRARSRELHVLEGCRYIWRCDGSAPILSRRTSTRLDCVLLPWASAGASRLGGPHTQTRCVGCVASFLQPLSEFEQVKRQADYTGCTANPPAASGFHVEKWYEHPPGFGGPVVLAPGLLAAPLPQRRRSADVDPRPATLERSVQGLCKSVAGLACVCVAMSRPRLAERLAIVERSLGGWRATRTAQAFEHSSRSRTPRLELGGADLRPPVSLRPRLAGGVVCRCACGAGAHGLQHVVKRSTIFQLLKLSLGLLGILGLCVCVTQR